MKAKKAARGIYSVVDPVSPWKLPSLDFSFPKYPGKMTAAEWKSLLAKAEPGDAEAEVRVAEHYSDGCKDRRGGALVQVSNRKAVEWYRRSAQHGSPIGQGALGYFLSEGIGAKKNAREAIRWMKKAYLNIGSSSDANNVAITYRQIGNLREAVRWFRIAIAAGDHGDLVQIGIHHYWGKGVRTDHAAAVRLFRKAIRGRNMSECERDDANFYLGIAYLEGKGVKKSLRMARKLLERANRDNDHLAAQRLLKQMARLG